MKRKFKINQRRGSWVAEVLTGKENLGLTDEDPFIAVIIDDGDSRFDWKSGEYLASKETTGLEDWWNRPQHSEWRRLMQLGRPIMVRKGMHWETRTAGPKVGVFRITDLRWDDHSLSFRLVERLGECE